MKRAVLCVGEDKYENLNPLSFAVEDAWRFRFFLSEIGFDIHHSLASPSNEDILKKMDDILAELDEGDLFVFYYAGHGIVFKNDYLLLDYQATDKESELEAGRHVIPLSYLKTRTGADKGIQRLFIFDSCRTELHGRSAVSKKSRGGRVIRNLVENKRIGGELSVVYSTAEGFPAEELPELEQGLFTKALLEEMKSRLHTALTFDSDLLKGVRSRMDAVRSQFGYDRSQKPALYVIDPITIYTGSPVVTPSHTNKGTQQKSMAQKKAGLTTSRKKKTPEKLGQKNKKPSGTGGGQGADVHFLPWVKFGISIFIVLLILSIAAALVIVTTDNLPYWYLKELPEWMLSEGQIVRREVGWLLEEGEHEKALVAAESGLQSGALDQEAYKRYREEIAAAAGADAEMRLRDLLEAPSYDDAGILLQQGLSWFGEELNQPLKQKLTAAAAAWVEEKVAELKEAEAYQEAYTAVNQLFEAGVLEAVVLDECKQDLEGSVIAGVEQAIRSGSYAEAYRILDSGVEEFLAVASLRELVETAEEEALLVEDLEAGLSVVVEARKGTQYGSVEAVTERMQLSEAVVVLEQERGNLAVLTGEDGLKILLDGESYGETGSGVLEDVAAGRYEVKITGGGWYYRGPVEIAAEETTWVLPELQAVGMLEVQAHVSGSVEIRGEKPVHLEAGDVYLSEQVPVGTTQVSFRYANGLQEIRELTIEQGERSTVGFSKTFGTLKLSVATGGTVYVDGKLKGVLEGGNTEDLGWLETGLRRIEIEYADGLREIQQVEIEQGESTNSIVFTRTFGEVAVRTATAGKVYLEGEEEELELSAGDRKVFPMTESGKRIVHIEYVNGMRESRDIIVHPDQSTTVEFTKTFGQVMISAAAEGELFIDRERQQSLGAGTEVVLDLETGERLVELHHPEGPVEARMVDLSSGETAEVIFSTIYGALLVSAATAGTLSIDGAAYGDVEAGSELELTGIETGERSIEIRYESGKTETQLVEIGSGATPEISFSTTFGGLQVRTAASGTVLVDGEEQGLLQAGGDLELTGIETGTRNVEFRYGNGMREAKDVVVREGTQHRVLFNAVYGKVSVRSETAGTVYADGERVRSITAGISEDLGWLEMGLRRIEIEYANGVREQQRVLVHEGERGSTVVFTKSFGDISVRTASYGRIYLDGNDEAAAAGREHLFEMLETGEHRITVEYPNGKRVEREVMVEPDQSVEVVFEEQFGSVQVRTATAGTVLIDGREILQLGAGETLTLTAQTGRRTISIDYGSGNREERTVAIDGDRVPSIAFEKEYGTIEVRSRSAGTIIIDGREAQNVGADKLIKLDMVEAGRRKLEIVYWNDYSENQTIEVRPQQSVPIEFDYQAVPLTYVEGGSFEMYTPYNHLRAATADSSVPLYIVQVNSFYIGTFEVTQDVYTQVMGNNPSRWKGDRLPVEQVSWFEAVEFCNALSRLEGRQEAYTIIGDVSVNWESNGYRLPTEAEWEYAARGGVKSGGYTYLGSNSAEDVAWFFRNSGKRTHPVGDKQPNELGLFDMGGNVSEWCWDWFDRDYYRNSSRENPTGPDSGSSRVLRGGAWNNWRTNIDADERGYDSPSKKYSTNGFRVLVPAVQGPL